MEYLHIRNFNAEKDYALLCEWWKAHNWEAIPFVWLPATGLMIEMDGVPICAGFLYRTDSVVAIFEYVISDPKADHKIKGLALDALIDAICLLAKSYGFSCVFSAFGNKRLAEKAQKHGFYIMGTDITNLMRGL